MNHHSKKRLDALREFMQNSDIQACIIPTTDPHISEYTPDHWKTRQWISGFTGSAGTMVVTHDKAGLWTDSRYFCGYFFNKLTGFLSNEKRQQSDF
jgi:Xaa-Pro aminopeptidase